jgi:hypothetical protein
MAQNQIWLDKDGGEPTIRISVGTGPRGTGRVRIWNPEGREPREKLRFGFDGSGFEDDKPLLDELTPTIDNLDKCTLTWSVRLAPRQAGAAGRYEVRVSVLQSGQAVPGSEFFYSGALVVDDVRDVGDIEVGDVALLQAI